MIYFYLVLITIHLWWIESVIKKNKLEQIEREKIFQKWAFDSLYSINHNVVLPEVYERKVINKPAKVYSPTEDPMYEFTHGLDEI